MWKTITISRAWEQIPGDDRNLLRQVLDTKLFAAPSGASGQGRAAPVHRQIAEFMAARYLAARIDAGLPADRVLSLIIGRDGGIVSEMRGLSAWLAVHSMGARAELIARDPLGTVLYGDARKFSKAEEKYRLIDSRGVEGCERPMDSLESFHRTLDWETSLPRIWQGPSVKLLSASAGNHTRQPFAFILLAILHRAPAIPELADSAWRRSSGM